MTLSDLTALMSRVGRRNPDLVQDRRVSKFIELCIDELREKKGVERAPVDIDPR